MKWANHRASTNDRFPYRGAEVLVNVATVCVLGFALFRLANSGPGSASEPRPPDPIVIEGAIGNDVSTLRTREDDFGAVDTVSLIGEATILYLFATTCSYCENQKAHIADFLTSIEGLRVVSASGEEPRVLEGYWGQRPIPVVSLEREAFAALQASGVPAMYLIDERGRVQRAFLGSMRHWSTESIHDAMIK